MFVTVTQLIFIISLQCSTVLHGVVNFNLPVLAGIGLQMWQSPATPCHSYLREGIIGTNSWDRHVDIMLIMHGQRVLLFDYELGHCACFTVL